MAIVAIVRRLRVCRAGLSEAFGVTHKRLTHTTCKRELGKKLVIGIHSHPNSSTVAHMANEGILAMA